MASILVYSCVPDVVGVSVVVGRVEVEIQMKSESRGM